MVKYFRLKKIMQVGDEGRSGIIRRDFTKEDSTLEKIDEKKVGKVP